MPDIGWEFRELALLEEDNCCTFCIEDNNFKIWTTSQLSRTDYYYFDNVIDNLCAGQ